MDLAQTTLPNGQQSGLRQGADQRLLGAPEGGDRGAGQDLRQHGGAVARRRTAWPAMSAATGTSSRFWSWNITSMCCGASPGLWPDPRPLDQQRQAGLWPASFDRIWQALMARQGKQNGTRQMVGLLKLGQTVRSRQAAGVGGNGPGGRMFRCRRGGAPAAPGRTAAARL